jgi:hypothetical protein
MAPIKIIKNIITTKNIIIIFGWIALTWGDKTPN